MGNGRHHPFAARCPAITPGHVRPRPGTRRERPAVRQVSPGCSLRQVARAAVTSGRSCSAAWAVFFCDSAPEPEDKSPSVERFASIPSAASKTQSSSMVMSSILGSPESRMRSPWGASFDFFLPPYLSALIVPFFRCLPTLHQLHNKADAHIKLLRRRIARGPRFNNSNNSFTKIFRIRSCHPWLASFNPAHSLNHFLRPLGIPFLILSMPDPL